jgi:hypothetical protein
MASFGDQPVWQPMYKPDPYDAMVFTESGAGGQHYYAMDSVGNVFCIDSPTACIQEAINYVLSKPTGGKVYIRAGDYYLAPLLSGQAVVSATIPYNAARIVEGDGDATRIHLPQNNSTANNNAWLFSWGWNGAAPYTRKSKLRNIAFINDVNTGSYSMNVLVTSSSTNNSSGLEIDSVSIYDIQGTSFGNAGPIWFNNLYDVTVSRYRFFSVNSNHPVYGIEFDSVALGKVVDSFFFGGGRSAIANGTGSILVDSVEIYEWGNAFEFISTDGESHIDVTNSIIGINRYGSQGIQGLYSTSYGPSNLIFNSGNGTVRFTITSSQLLAPISYNANGASASAYITARGNLINTGCAGYVIGISNPGSGYIYMDVSDNVLGMSYGYSPCGGNFISGIGDNTYLRIKDNLILDNGNQSMWLGGVAPSATVEIDGNEIYLLGTNNGYSARNQFIWFGNSSSGGLLKFINNTVTWTATPSSATTFYLTYNPNSSGTYYMPTIIIKGNKFNFPTSNAAFGGFAGSAGATTSNLNALFVDLDNAFNLSINLPYPSITTPSVPSSGTAQQNTYPYPVEAYVSGGSATAVQVTRGGVTYTVWSSSTATAIPPLLVRLEPGDSITITYSTAPSWTWVPAKYIE